MLVELRIRNFAIIEKAVLEFGPGLNVLSGETGAGKTIVMSALGLLLGGRASPDLVRIEAKEATVEGLFEIDRNPSAFDEFQIAEADGERELVIRRIIAEGGRSRAFVNGGLAAVQTLARIGTDLVQIYGQHEQQSLLRTDLHLPVLDGFAALGDALAEYRAVYQQARELRTRLAEVEARSRDRDRILELARFQIQELERAGLAAGEDAELAASRTVLANSAKLAAAANEAEEMLYGGEGAAIDLIARARSRLAEAALIDSTLTEIVDLVDSAATSLQEAAHALRIYAERIDADPVRLEEVDNRLQELQRIKRKYGGTIESAIEALEGAKHDCSELESTAETRTALERELAAQLERLLRMAAMLSARRSESAALLKRSMETELKALGIANAVFEVRLGKLAAAEETLTAGEVALGRTGSDTAEFYLSPNLGQPAMPLARIASGGELSRVMLALKRLEARQRSVATVIFDEVDAGIGGTVAEAVGRKLKQLAQFHQVICITHLPQIAAFADHHFLVEKEQRRGATASRVRTLEKSRRADEIARMIGGNAVTEKLLRAARELIERASAL